MTIHFGDSTSIATATGLGAGILQVKQALRTSVYSESVGQGNISANLVQVSITPSSSSNKILVMVTGEMACNTSHGRSFVLRRNNTSICVGDASSSRVRRSSGSTASNSSSPSPITMTFLDDPQTTSALTYSFALSHQENGTLTVYLNRTEADNNSSHIGRFASTTTVMEIDSGIL
tara:strand:+ start:43 stop:570 length:528 start_codon:yes stop_codon:yes gene_type:complete